MAAKIATGTVETPFGVSLRDKLTKALMATGYNAAKVKRVTRYPRVVRWKITPTGEKPTPFGIRIRNKRTGQQFVHVATGQGLSAGEMRIDTPADMQTGDVLEIDQPSGYPSFPYTITFEFEGQQFQTVENRRPVKSAQVPLPQCTFTVVNVDSVDDTINLVSYETAVTWLQTIQSVTATADGSASAAVGSDTASVSGAVVATSTNAQAVGGRGCSIVGDSDTAQIFDEVAFDGNPIVDALLKAESQIIGTSQEYRVGGAVIGYSLPFFVRMEASATDYILGGSSLRRYTIRSGAAVAGATSTEQIEIGGVTLTAEINEGDSGGGTEAELSPSVAVQLGVMPTVQDAMKPNSITIPPPPGWPD